MAYGDIGAVVDAVEFDSSQGYASTLVKLANGVMAVFYMGPGSDGFVKTYPVDTDGNIGSMIDDYEFEADTCYPCTYRPWVVHVSGDVYAVSYKWYDDYCAVLTQRIADDGTIGSQPAASIWGDVVFHGGIVKKPGTTTYLLCYEGTGGFGVVYSVYISNNGASISEIDGWNIGTADEPCVIHISGDIFAVLYNDGTNKSLKTFSVADDGTITKSFIDTEAVYADLPYAHQIEHVYDDIYAVFVMGTGYVLTYRIASDGSITYLNTGNFYDAALLDVRAINLGRSGNSVYFAITGQTGYDGYISTFPIGISGTIGAKIDSAEVVPNIYQYGYNIIEIQPGIYAFAWATTPGVSGRITTLPIESPPPTDFLFSGMFMRGSEIQAVFTAEGKSRPYRSPDFGKTWYLAEGLDNLETKDICFATRNNRNSFVGGNNKLYPNTTLSGSEIFIYAADATVAGEVSRIAADVETETAFVGTDEHLYKTTDWGDTVRAVLDEDITDVALGGVTTKPV